MEPAGRLDAGSQDRLAALEAAASFGAPAEVFDSEGECPGRAREGRHLTWWSGPAVPAGHSGGRGPLARLQDSRHACGGGLSGAGGGRLVRPGTHESPRTGQQVCELPCALVPPEAEVFQRKLDETTRLLRELQEAQNERLSTRPPPNTICLLGPSYRELHLGRRPSGGAPVGTVDAVALAPVPLVPEGAAFQGPELSSFSSSSFQLSR